MYAQILFMLKVSLCLSLFLFPFLNLSDTGIDQSQDDSVVSTKQYRQSVAIKPIMSSLSSSNPDLLQPTISMLSFLNSTGKTSKYEHSLYKKFSLYYIERNAETKVKKNGGHGGPGGSVETLSAGG